MQDRKRFHVRFKEADKEAKRATLKARENAEGKQYVFTSSHRERTQSTKSKRTTRAWLPRMTVVNEDPEQQATEDSVPEFEPKFTPAGIETRFELATAYQMIVAYITRETRL
jgi:hypothetical protein